jgi:hypothetical protein
MAVAITKMAPRGSILTLYTLGSEAVLADRVNASGHAQVLYDAVGGTA